VQITKFLGVALSFVAGCTTDESEGESQGESAEGTNDAGASTNASSSDAGDTTQANTTGADFVQCEPAASLDLEVVLEPAPPEEGPDDTFEFHGPCTVASVSDTPTSLSLECLNGEGTLAVSVLVNGMSAPALAQEFQVEDVVELNYATIRGVFKSPAWAAVRHDGASGPALVALRSWQPVPWFGDPDFMSPLAVEFLTNTDCEESAGSCNVGPRRRAAVEFSADGQDSTIIFDQNEDEVDSYRVLVGEATVDEGDCEGVNETWYEMVIIQSKG
jgi:hypothetical protein